jgi:hypothetical protein
MIHLALTIDEGKYQLYTAYTNVGDVATASFCDGAEHKLTVTGLGTGETIPVTFDNGKAGHIDRYGFAFMEDDGRDTGALVAMPDGEAIHIRRFKSVSSDWMASRVLVNLDGRHIEDIDPVLRHAWGQEQPTGKSWMQVNTLVQVAA